MKQIISIILAVLLIFMLGFMFGEIRGVSFHDTDEADTVRDTIYDTIHVIEPVPVDSMVVRYKTVKVPVIDTIKIYDFTNEDWYDPITDSALVSLPITEMHYHNELYDAYISGFEPSLDSIFIHQPTITITKNIKPRKWGVGLQGGYGMTPKGFQPYVGLGFYYRLF